MNVLVADPGPTGVTAPGPPLVHPRVLIVASNASTVMGGEAILPVHYFRVLRERSVEAWLITHERNRAALTARFPADGHRMLFVPDTRLHRWLNRIGKALPVRVNLVLFGFLLFSATQRRIARLARRVVREHRIEVVHEPMPVSPKMVSFMHRLGAPVVIGPTNGGMSYPPAFRHMESPIERFTVTLGRGMSGLMNWIAPGKRRAARLLVANERTRRAIPPGVRAPVEQVIENGVDLNQWPPPRPRGVEPERPTRFVFVGRLVDWKALDLAIEAAALAAEGPDPIELHVIGDGPYRARWEALAAQRAGRLTIQFHGFLPQQALGPLLDTMDVLVLPSLYECGGAVVLEAMAMAMPVIATRWGGPTDYLDDTCGILVAPDGRESLIRGFADAMRRLAESPPLRVELGLAGRQRIEDRFDWDRKVDAMLDIYRAAIGDHARL